MKESLKGEAAVSFAHEFVRDQYKVDVDKAGVPYLYHLEAVRDIATKISNTKQSKNYPLLYLRTADLDVQTLQTIALLHDAVEDGKCDLEWIEKMFGMVVGIAVDALTHRKNEPYMKYIERVKENPYARTVKIADLRHNTDILRLNELTDKDWERLKKYHKSYRYLMDM